MRRAPLVLALLLALPAAAQKEFDDSFIRVYYQPQNLWRTESGAFVGRREGKSIVLTYDFFDDGDYASCPPLKGGGECGDFQDAVSAALEMWGEASQTLVWRRRASPSEPVNVWIAWAPPSAFGGRPPVARSIDNSRDASTPDRNDSVRDFHGFRVVAYPNDKKSSGALIFNSRYCWHLGDKSVCKAPPAAASGKIPEYEHDARIVALHESGHVMGFGHFTNDSIMGLSGGTERYELTAYDREAVRLLYARVATSVPLQ